MKVGRKFYFDSAHSIESLEDCSRIHGHTYELEVVLSGEKEENGMVFDFEDIKKLVEEEILSSLDHRNLDNIFDKPTTENISKWIFKKLEGLLSKKSVNLVKIKLWEGKGKWVEIERKN